jgi:hypothetical protein
MFTSLLVKNVRINVLLLNRSFSNSCYSHAYFYVYVLDHVHVHVRVHVHVHFNSRFHVWIYKIIFENAASVISSWFFARMGFILNI